VCGLECAAFEFTLTESPSGFCVRVYIRQRVGGGGMCFGECICTYLQDTQAEHQGERVGLGVGVNVAIRRRVVFFAAAQLGLDARGRAQRS
jgi:hypothetical protein